jgi:hypothetical protein
MNPAFGDWREFERDCDHLRGGGIPELQRVDREELTTWIRPRNGKIDSVEAEGRRGFSVCFTVNAALKAFTCNTPYTPAPLHVTSLLACFPSQFGDTLDDGYSGDTELAKEMQKGRVKARVKEARKSFVEQHQPDSFSAIPMTTKPTGPVDRFAGMAKHFSLDVRQRLAKDEPELYGDLV